MTRPADTSPEIQARLDAHYRAMSPRQRFFRVLALGEVASMFALSKIRAEHPDEPDDVHRLRLALRTLPPELGRALALRRGHAELIGEHR